MIILVWASKIISISKFRGQWAGSHRHKKWYRRILSSWLLLSKLKVGSSQFKETASCGWPWTWYGVKPGERTATVIVSSSSKLSPKGSVHMWKPPWENAQVQAAEFSCFKGNNQRFYQATGVIWYMKGEHAVMGAAQISWEDLRNEQLCVVTLTWWCCSIKRLDKTFSNCRKTLHETDKPGWKVACLKEYLLSSYSSKDCAHWKTWGQQAPAHMEVAI